MRVRIHGEYLLICQLFVQNNISHEKLEHLYIYPEISCICHNILSGNVCITTLLGFANRTTVRQLPKCNTLVSVTIRMLFQIATKMEVTWLDVTMVVWHSHPNCCNKVASVGLCGILALSSSCCWTSEKVSWWLRLSKSCWSAEMWLTVVLFSKPRILCWRYTCPDNAL